MDFFEKRVKRDVIYNGKIIDVYKDEVLLSNDKKAVREYVQHRGGVSVALEKDNMFFLVKQYRYGQSKVMWEFPAGKKEVNEEAIVTGKREVLEEVGYSSSDYLYLTSLVPTGAYLSEVIELYYAKAKEFVGQNLDDDEYVEVKLFKLDEIISMIMKREIVDAKTIAMAFMVKELGLVD